MLKIAFFVSAVILLFSLYFHNVIEFDQDLGRHLLLGKIITETGQVPQTNLLSYTYSNFPFINTHWLAEVIFYQVNDFLGTNGLLTLKVLCFLSAMGLTVLTAYRYSKSLWATAATLALFAPILLERTEIRPEIFSYLFTAIFIFFMLRNKFSKWLYFLLPFLEILWVNSHIYFIIGPALLFIATVADRRWLKVFILTCAATLINPNGLAGTIYPLRVFENYGYTIVENQNIFFLKDLVFNPNITFFFIALAAFTLSFLLAGKKSLVLINLALAALAVLPIMAIRSFPFLFILELPVLAYNLAKVKISFEKWVILAVIALSLFRSFRLMTNDYYLTIGSHKRFTNNVSESGKGAVDFVLAHKLAGPIFNNFDIGSYLDYRFYPKVRVYVDGRPEAYPASFFQGEYIPAQMTADNFAEVARLRNINLVIFSHTDATPWAQKFLSIIIHNQDFKMVYLDSFAVVFVRKEVTLPVVSFPNSPSDLMALARVAQIFGNEKQAQKYLIQAYVKDPKTNQKPSLILF